MKSMVRSVDGLEATVLYVHVVVVRLVATWVRNFATIGIGDDSGIVVEAGAIETVGYRPDIGSWRSIIRSDCRCVGTMGLVAPLCGNLDVIVLVVVIIFIVMVRLDCVGSGFVTFFVMS